MSKVVCDSSEVEYFIVGNDYKIVSENDYSISIIDETGQLRSFYKNVMTYGESVLCGILYAQFSFKN